MSIGLTDALAPLGAFHLVDDSDFKGSYRTVASTTERDAIVTASRKVGMLVYTVATAQTWILGPGITNSDWTLFSLGVAPGGGEVIARTTVTGPTTYALLITDHFIYVNTTAGAVTLTLPAHGATNKIYEIKDIAGTFPTNNCTLARNGGTGTIEGLAANYVMVAAYQALRIASNAVSAWYFH